MIKYIKLIISCFVMLFAICISVSASELQTEQYEFDNHTLPGFINELTIVSEVSGIKMVSIVDGGRYEDLFPEGKMTDSFFKNWSRDTYKIVIYSDVINKKAIVGWEEDSIVKSRECKIEEESNISILVEVYFTIKNNLGLPEFEMNLVNFGTDYATIETLENLNDVGTIHRVSNLDWIRKSIDSSVTYSHGNAEIAEPKQYEFSGATVEGLIDNISILSKLSNTSILSIVGYGKFDSLFPNNIMTASFFEEWYEDVYDIVIYTDTESMKFVIGYVIDEVIHSFTGVRAEYSDLQVLRLKDIISLLRKSGLYRINSEFEYTIAEYTDLNTIYETSNIKGEDAIIRKSNPEYITEFISFTEHKNETIESEPEVKEEKVQYLESQETIELPFKPEIEKLPEYGLGFKVIAVISSISLLVVLTCLVLYFKIKRGKVR